MTVKQALERLRMRCSRSEHSSGQVEKLLRRWMGTAPGKSGSGAEYVPGRLKKGGAGKGPEKENVTEKTLREEGLQKKMPPAKASQKEIPSGKFPEKKFSGKKVPAAGGRNPNETKLLAADDIPEILRSLKEDKFIDDRRFAAAYIRDKLRFNGWGRNKISYMLRSLGVEEEIIREALAENYGDENAENGCGAEEVLRKLVSNKWKSLKKEEPLQTKKMKVIRFAVGRGFEYSQVLEILQEIAKTGPGDLEEETDE